MRNIALVLAFVVILYVFRTGEGSVLTDFELIKKEDGFSYAYLETWIPDWSGDINSNGNFHFKLEYFPKNELFGSEESNAVCEIVVLTAGNESFNTLLELKENRLEYSRKHDYCYVHFSCNDNASTEE
ncbi:hypothetical protein FG386_003371 [Cryptosporidium ryanae]|uniref:uncharacterized protein n=1 Tax=Cryptosporidium ryanae TaxID=515981 RepID=UPI00351A9B60|nr:hypothetical protein FG386_003371 [Cryptosporidium ryanae]